MQPKTIEIENRQVIIHSDHEMDREVLLWIDDRLQHVFRYLGAHLHNEIMAWVKANTKGIFFADLNPQQEGIIHFGDLTDATLFERTFRDRLW